MDSTLRKKPKPLAEMLPELNGLLTKKAIQANCNLTATKKARPTTAMHTQTSEKVMKSMTFAEIQTVFNSMHKSPKRPAQSKLSNRKKWNSSCKLENKTVSHTANGQMKHNVVRKVLNFQQTKPKVAQTCVSQRMTTMAAEVPKFTKPEVKAKKSLYLQARNTVRISGICDIPETPVVNKPVCSRMTLASKMNVPKIIATKNVTFTPKSALRKRLLASKIPDTPLSNECSNSSCDASFLQNEENIEYIESKGKALEEESLDKIAEVSPPMSTPFADYQNVKHYFDNSSDVMESLCHDDTIMNFDKSISIQNNKSEESVIVSLCDMLNKARVSNGEKPSSTDLEDLLEVQRQTESNIKMIEIGINMFTNIKQSQLKTLLYVNKLIQEKNQRTSESEKDKTVVEAKESHKLEKKLNRNGNGDCSEYKTKPNSPIYKIPKKNHCLKNYKSIPNVSGAVTPQKKNGKKALSMYLKMKEKNNFLNTPLAKQRPAEVPDTPARTSHNLQKQLESLYES